MNRPETFIRAVARIVLHNRKIIESLSDTRDFYVHGARPPKAVPLLSVSLKCEENGSHQYLENLFTWFKKLGRGPKHCWVIRHWLEGTSVRLLDELRSLANLLPVELDVSARNLRHAVEHSRNMEKKITNFVLGESGAGLELTSAQLNERLDKLLRDLKRSFGEIVLALDDIEIALSRRVTPAPKAKRRLAVKPEPTPEELKLRQDKIDLRQKVRAMVAYKTKNHIKTNMRRELRLLRNDPKWGKICQQWPNFDTLYDIVIRKKC